MSFNVLCLYILPVKCSTLKSAHFPNAKTQMPCHNWIQSIDRITTYMFLQTSAILDHTQHTSSTVFLVSNTNKRKTSYALWFKLHLSGNTYIICTVLPTHYGSCYTLCLSHVQVVTGNRNTKNKRWPYERSK